MEERGREVDCRLARKKGRRADRGRKRKGGFSTKLRLKVFKECQRGTLYPFSSVTYCPSSPPPRLSPFFSFVTHCSPTPICCYRCVLQPSPGAPNERITPYRSRRSTWHLLVFIEANAITNIVEPCWKHNIFERSGSREQTESGVIAGILRLCSPCCSACVRRTHGRWIFKCPINDELTPFIKSPMEFCTRTADSIVNHRCETENRRVA